MSFHVFLQDVYESIQDIVGHLFIPRVSPERPSPGFFKGLFGGGYTSVDREELCMFIFAFLLQFDFFIVRSKNFKKPKIDFV